MRMKIIHKLLYVWCITWLASCSTDEHLPEAEGGKIMLSISTGISVSRATEDTAIEAALSHFDVFIWNLDTDNKPKTIKHYERIQGPLTSPTDTATLSAAKGDFTTNASYRVDVIANATATEETFRTYTDFSQLSAAVQEDERIQVTGGHELGAVGTTIGNVPSHFLMDGIATLANATTGNTAVLNDGKSETTQLKVTLQRAAAKIEVRLKPGSTIKFMNDESAKAAMGYNLRNMPYTTSVLTEVTSHDPKLRKTDFFADATNIFFNWTADQVTVTAYVYSHQWEQTNFFDEGTRMTVNLPVVYTPAGATEGTEYVNSFYQILLTKDSRFERNTHYIVEATIDAPGAIDNSEPVELKELKYFAAPWTEVEIKLGEEVKPTYLSVNKDTLDMHNIAKDSTSLSFVSSSDVSVEVEEVYYIDKFGQKKTVEDHGVVVTADAGLSGNITVNSPVPENNAIRYIKLKITNEDDSDPEYVLVRQYPLEYITNIQAWYSYRSDFGGTTFQNYGENGYVGATWESNRWNYSRNEGTSNGALFGSKVAEANADGTSELFYYYWWEQSQNQGGGRPGRPGSSGGSSYTQSSEAIKVPGNLTELDNARMYHVRITSTSGEYKVGIPKQDIGEDGGHYTVESTVNNELVSPSFMIASQLGASQSMSSKAVAAEHCANYVETYKEGNDTIHLTNWRLPTQKEIQIITKFQTVPDAAMDIVLSGDNYWSAAGIVNKTSGELNNINSANIRCVRDAY